MGFYRSDPHQVSVLSERYLDTMLGDLGGLGLTLLQAPILALGIGGVFQNLARDTLTLYFVLCLSAFFLGAINASREIVKERALFLREKMYNLSVPAYLRSKFRVQLILVVLASLSLGLVTSFFVPLRINVFAVCAVLALTCFAGTATGLLISAWVSTNDRAVGLVPLVVIPQILFSEVVVGEGRLANWASWVEKLMPVRWGFRMLKELRKVETDWASIGGALIVFGIIAFLCYTVSLFKLRRARYT